MKKTLLMIAMSLSLTTFAQETKIDNMSLSVTGGYSDHLLRNGVSRLNDTYSLGLDIMSPATNNFVPVDLYVGGTYLASDLSSPEGSIWYGGLGKTVELNDKYSLRLDGVVSAIDTNVDHIPNTVDASITAALINPLVTPYVSYTKDWQIEQNGWTFGVTKDIPLSIDGEEWLQLTPDVSYYMFDDYESLVAKARLSVVRWDTVTPFIEGRYLDNDFDAGSVNWATHEGDSEFSYFAGLKFDF